MQRIFVLFLPILASTITLIGPTSLFAQSEFLHEKVGPFGPLTRDNFYKNLASSRSFADYQRVMKATMLENQETTEELISKTPPYLLRRLHFDIAKEILHSRYGLNDEKINILFESDHFWSQRPFYLVWAMNEGLPGLLALSGSALCAFIVARYQAPVMETFVVAVVGLFAGYAAGLIPEIALVRAGRAPSEQIARHVFNSTGVKIKGNDVKAIRALIQACARSS